MGNDSSLPTDWESREKLREKGQFWTPPWVARAMVAYAMRGDSSVLYDPAVGGGAFFEAFLALRQESDERTFFGTDIDESLLRGEIFGKPFCRVEQRDFALDPPPGRYGAIVANPPYIRHHRLPAHIKNALRELCLREIGRPLDGRAGLHVYFLIRALSMLKEGGRLAFIVPADTCEGVFARHLWAWIASRFRLDAVVAFDPDATPFPGVDTNAVILMIRNAPPRRRFAWIRCREAETPDLTALMQRGLRSSLPPSLERTDRDVDEGVTTGLSRPPATAQTRFKLGDFATVRRGIATGANAFFWLTRQQAEAEGIPEEMLRLVVGRTRDVPGDVLETEDLERLEGAGRPTYLLCLDGQAPDDLPPRLREYIRRGEQDGLNRRALLRTRRPWYRMERRTPPPLLFAYLGRRNSRFVRNRAGVVPLTCFLCVYPHPRFANSVDNLWRVLNAPETIQNLRLVGKSYGGGAIKVEPRNLERLPVPDHLVLNIANETGVQPSRPLFPAGGTEANPSASSVR